MEREVLVVHRVHLDRQPWVEEVVEVRREVAEAEEVPSWEVEEVEVVPEPLGWTEGWECGLSWCCLVPAFGGQPIAFGLD